MFCDEVEIIVKAGNGGDGHMSFRSEKYLPHGGPDGGDGGKGGDVIFKVNCNLNTLASFRLRSKFVAKNGEPGGKNDRAGKNGESIVFEVPKGTILYDKETNQKIVDLNDEKGLYTICFGGRGGFGNAHFASSTRQAPRFAEKGEPGQEKSLRMELQMVADVGIIGLPSAGKSTFISRVSNAKPKIGDYPFTTLIPNLGVVTTGEKSYVVADVPGLIEGASEGRGLGDKFLKHIRRTKILVHLIDINEMHLADNYFIIINELKKFDKTLSHKPQIVVLNKIDTVDTETVTMITKQFCKETKLKQKDVHAISSVSGKGVDALMYVIKDTLKEYEVEEDVFADKEYKIYTPGNENDNPKKFTVEKEGELYRVKGKRVEQIAIMTDEKNEQAMMRLYDVLKKMRIIVELEKMGIKNGERIIVEEKELIYNDFL